MYNVHCAYYASKNRLFHAGVDKINWMKFHMHYRIHHAISSLEAITAKLK